MRILWLNAGLLLPLDKGGKLRTWHLMRHLAKQHDITYLSFADPAEPPAHVEGMREVCRALETVPRAEVGKDGLSFYADVVAHIPDPLPYAVAKYRSRPYAQKLRQLLATYRFDVVVCDFLFPAVNVPARLDRPTVLFTHNVESEIWRRHAATQSNPIRRGLFASQWKKMLRYEGDAIARFDLVLAVSEADANTFERVYPRRLRQPIHVVRTGVDTEYFRPDWMDAAKAASHNDPAHDAAEAASHDDPALHAAEAASHDHHAPTLVFTGSMDWIPNEDAMVYFVSEILPRIRERVPEARLAIVGRSPTPRVRALADRPGVIVTGAVDDVRPFVSDGGVYVVPLRIGGGTRLKIFEAMAMGKVVVSTTVGAEGLPVTNGQDVVIEDTPDRFAASVVHLLEHAEDRARLERAARDLVVRHYDWSAVASDLDVALAGAVARWEAGEAPASAITSFSESSR